MNKKPNLRESKLNAINDVKIRLLCHDNIGLNQNGQVQYNIYCDKKIINDDGKLKKLCVNQILKTEGSLYDEKKIMNLVRIEKKECGDKNQLGITLQREGVDDIFKLDVKILGKSNICKLTSSQKINSLTKLLENEDFDLSKGKLTFKDKSFHKNEKIKDCGFAYGSGSINTIIFEEIDNNQTLK